MKLRKSITTISIVVILVICIFFLISKYYSVSITVFKSPQKTSSTNPAPNVSAEPTKSQINAPEPTSKYLKTIISSDYSLYLSPLIESTPEKLVLTITVRDDNGVFRILKDNEEFTNDTETFLLQEAISFENERYVTYLLEDSAQNKEYKTIAAINHTNSQIAILLPTEVVIITFKTSEERPFNNPDITLPVLRITDLRRLPLRLTSNDYFYPQIFFSETDNYLYVANSGIKNEVWGYRIKTSDFEYIPLEFRKTDFYPLANSDGIIYWGKPDLQVNPNSYNIMNYITLDYLINRKIINITDNQQNANIGSYDYDGLIITNSSHTKLCAERGASGYWGYVVGSIVGDDLITNTTGIQYSHCEYWINNNELVLHENPYQNQFLVRYFSYNTITNMKKTLIYNTK